MCKKCKKHKKYLPETHPWLIEDWDDEKNGDLKPGDVTYGSGKKVHWVHGEDKPCGGHSWKAILSNRTKKVNPRGCPACAGRVLTDKNRLSITHPKLSESWHPNKNEGLLPEMVSFGSHKRVHWLCDRCQCSWETEVKSRSLSGSGCPVCLIKADRKIPEGKSLLDTHKQISAGWLFSKNGTLKPSGVTHGSHRKVWWKCDVPECGHEWEMVIYTRTGKSSGGCPACSGYIVTDRNRLTVRFPKVSREWYYPKNGSLRPEDISFGSDRTVFWKCSRKVCSHVWKSIVCNRTKKINPRGCPACAGRVVTDLNRLSLLFPDLLEKSWDYDKNGNLSPDDLSFGSNRRVSWKCNKKTCGHEWKTKVCSRTSKEQTGCPKCYNGAVSDVSQQWLDDLNIEVREHRIKGLGGERGFRVDGFDPETNTVYEFLGDYWHGNPKKFSPGKINPHNKKSFGQLHQETMERIEILKENGYKVVYIWERDFRLGKMESVE